MVGFFPDGKDSHVASVCLPSGQSSVASKNYSSPMNPFVVEECPFDVNYCVNALGHDDASWQPLRHQVTRLPPRGLCRKIGALHEAFIERPTASKHTVFAGLETYNDEIPASMACDVHRLDARPVREGATILSQKQTLLPENSQLGKGQTSDDAQLRAMEKSLGPSSSIRENCNREAAVRPAIQLRLPWTRRGCMRVGGRAMQRCSGRALATTAYGGPAPTPSPKPADSHSKKAAVVRKRSDGPENDVAQEAEKRHHTKNVNAENVRGAAYTRAPARTVGVLRNLLRHARSQTGLRRQSIAKCTNRSGRQLRSNDVAFTSF